MTIANKSRCFLLVVVTAVVDDFWSSGLLMVLGLETLQETRLPFIPSDHFFICVKRRCLKMLERDVAKDNSFV